MDKWFLGQKARGVDMLISTYLYYTFEPICTDLSQKQKL